MKTIVSAKQIFTHSVTKPTCHHMIIENGIILELLDKLPEVMDFEYESVTYENSYIYPAFIDTHMHLVGYGAYLSQCQLEKATSISELKILLQQYLKSIDLSVIIGRGWNHDLFIDGRLPNRDDLDEICSDRPIILYRVCGHIAVVNSKALEHYHIDEFTVVDGGYIDIHDGKPTGILRENALTLVQNAMTLDEIQTFILQAQSKLNAYGITSVHTDDLIVVPQTKHKELLALFREMAAQNKLTVRVYEQSQFFTVENFKRHIIDGYKQNKGDLFFKNGPLKILADGSLGARTAKLRAPYQDDPSASGILIHSENELINLITCAFENDIDVAIHGIGDYTIDFIITQITDLQKKYPRSNPRNAIVHCQIMDNMMIDMMAQSKISALVQPVFLEYDMSIVENRVGRALASTSYAYKSMLALGITLGFGSDAPVEDPNPLRSIYYAVTRQRPDGLSFFKEECLSLEEAFHAFTSNAAYFSYEENIKGKLLPGFLADFICLATPLDAMAPEELLNAKIESTYLGGKCVYAMA